MPTLHLICGLPGSGKSTFAKVLEKETGALRFSPDERIIELGGDGFDTEQRIEVEAAQWEAAKAALREGCDVILENGFWERDARDHLRVEARALGAATTLHYLHADIEELKRRLAARNANPPPGSFVLDPDMLDRWVTLFEVPTEDELS